MKTYFLASILLLCIDIPTENILVMILFYGFALINVFYSVYLNNKDYEIRKN